MWMMALLFRATCGSGACRLDFGRGLLLGGRLDSAPKRATAIEIRDKHKSGSLPLLSTTESRRLCRPGNRRTAPALLRVVRCEHLRGVAGDVPIDPRVGAVSPRAAATRRPALASSW